MSITYNAPQKIKLPGLKESFPIPPHDVPMANSSTSLILDSPPYTQQQYMVPVSHAPYSTPQVPSFAQYSPQTPLAMNTTVQFPNYPYPYISRHYQSHIPQHTQQTQNGYVTFMPSNFQHGQAGLELAEFDKPKQYSLWSTDDDRLLRHLKEEKHLGWREIAMHFNSRTASGCQFRWRRLMGLEKDRKRRKKVSSLKKLLNWRRMAIHVYLLLWQAL